MKKYIVSMSHDVVIKAKDDAHAKRIMYRLNDEVTDMLCYWNETECTGLSVAVSDEPVDEDEEEDD